MRNIRTGKVSGQKFNRMFRFVVRPKDPMQLVYRKDVPEFGIEIVKGILDKNGDRYFYDEIKLN